MRRYQDGTAANQLLGCRPVLQDSHGGRRFFRLEGRHGDSMIGLNVDSRDMHAAPSTAISMEDHLGPIKRNGSTTRCFKPEVTGFKQRVSGSHIRTADGLSMGVLHVIMQRSKAVRREKEEIRAVVRADDARSLDKGAVALGDIENDLWLPDLGDAVAFHFLEHDGNGDEWSPAVSTVPPVSDTVAIRLVGDIRLSVDVSEWRRINGTAVFVRTCKGFLLRDKWADGIWTLGDRDADAVMSMVVFHLARVVEYEPSVVLEPAWLEANHQRC